MELDNDFVSMQGSDSDSDEQQSGPQESMQGRRVPKVRIATVDNFQGEESDIVIVSLVRNNTAGSLGFLASINRTNVLLSRAKHAMYIFGSAKTLRTRNSNFPGIWDHVLDLLENEGRIRRNLELVCAKHPDQVRHVTTPDGFDDGPCNIPCDYVFPCGHNCPRICHSNDNFHMRVSMHPHLCESVHLYVYACVRGLNVLSRGFCSPYKHISITYTCHIHLHERIRVHVHQINVCLCLSPWLLYLCWRVSMLVWQGIHIVTHTW
jgi:hypothetical protein